MINSDFNRSYTSLFYDANNPVVKIHDNSFENTFNTDKIYLRALRRTYSRLKKNHQKYNFIFQLFIETIRCKMECKKKRREESKSSYLALRCVIMRRVYLRQTEQCLSSELSPHPSRPLQVIASDRHRPLEHLNGQTLDETRPRFLDRQAPRGSSVPSRHETTALQNS